MYIHLLRSTKSLVTEVIQLPPAHTAEYEQAPYPMIPGNLRRVVDFADSRSTYK